MGDDKLARRCSYEEMVHEETPTSSAEDKFSEVVLRITHWGLTLHDLQLERANGGHLISSSKCLCHKASSIGQGLAHLTNLMAKSVEANNEDSEVYLTILLPTLDEVQSALRAGVSIQISKPSEAALTRATTTVEAALATCDKVTYAKAVIDSINKSVQDLLHVPTCGHASNANLLDDSDQIRDVSPTRLMEQDEEEDIRSQIAAMFKNNDDSDDESAMDTKGSDARQARKRKSFIKSGLPPTTTSPTSSPSKRPRKLLQSPTLSSSFCISSSAPAKICQTVSPALDLLETKKKAPRSSLYHWVLWREALRGEKDRMTYPSPKRLSFST